MTLQRFGEAWVARLRAAPDAFKRPGVTAVERDDLDAVVVVALGDSYVIVAPSRVIPLLERASRLELTDATRLAAELNRLMPEVSGWTPIGTAALWLTDSAPSRGPMPAAPAGPDDVAAVRCACTDDEWDECGIGAMRDRWVALDCGQPAAIAGHEVWDDRLAHLGVLSATEVRGRGAGYSAAGTAIGAALSVGLLPQWRSGVDNYASAALATRLGFTRVGYQCAIAMEGVDR